MERSGGGGGGHGDGVRLGALSFHGLVLAAGGEAEACREDCLFILDSRSKLLLVTFVSPGYLVLPLAAKLLLIRYLGENVRGEHIVL